MIFDTVLILISSAQGHLGLGLKTVLFLVMELRSCGGTAE